MKKLIGLVCCLVSGFVLADGFYIGGQAGVDTTKMNRKMKAEPSFLGKVSSGDGFMSTGGGYFGYRINHDQDSLLNIEVDALFGSKSYKENIVNSTVLLGSEYKDKNADSYGLSILSGYGVGERVDIYGRLGVSMTTVKNDTYQKTLRPLGVVLGLGVQAKVYGNFFVRLDYRYIHYQKKKMSIEADPAVQNLNIEYLLNKNILMIGLHYQF